MNRFSPSFDFPMGRSFYAAIRLPRSQGVYGLRIRSFANRQVVYPSLLFLDEHKRPTRLVSDAVYKLNPEPGIATLSSRVRCRCGPIAASATCCC